MHIPDYIKHQAGSVAAPSPKQSNTVIFLQQKKRIFTLNGISRLNVSSHWMCKQMNFVINLMKNLVFKDFWILELQIRNADLYKFVWQDMKDSLKDPFLQMKTQISFQIHYKLTGIFFLILLNVHLKYIYT